jgi:hypothetical protein
VEIVLVLEAISQAVSAATPVHQSQIVTKAQTPAIEFEFEDDFPSSPLHFDRVTPLELHSSLL